MHNLHSYGQQRELLKNPACGFYGWYRNFDLIYTVNFGNYISEESPICNLHWLQHENGGGCRSALTLVPLNVFLSPGEVCSILAR